MNVNPVTATNKIVTLTSIKSAVNTPHKWDVLLKWKQYLREKQVIYLGSLQST